MQQEPWIAYRADARSVLTNAVDPDWLSRTIQSWSIPPAAPDPVRRLWDRACGQFYSGPVAYEQFTGAVRSGLEAVESALRHHVRDLLVDRKRITFGPLIALANEDGRLSPQQHEWLSMDALRVRNELTHPDLREPLVYSPPMAADMMQAMARFLTDLLEPLPSSP